MNRIIKLLILSDIFVITGFGLIEPIIAVFIKENLIGGSIVAAGMASTIFLLVKSVAQIPAARYSDEKQNRIFLLILGSILVAIVPFIYIFSATIKQIYLAQVVYGLGSALAYPSWLALFSNNLDKKQEGFEWALYSTAVGIGTALTAYIGASIADAFGFKIVFSIVGALSVVGAMILFGLERKSVARISYHYPLLKGYEKAY